MRTTDSQAQRNKAADTCALQIHAFSKQDDSRHPYHTPEEPVRERRKERVYLRILLASLLLLLKVYSKGVNSPTLPVASSEKTKFHALRQCASVPFSSVAQSCPTLQPCELQHAWPLPVHQLPELVMPSSHLILSYPSPAPNPSQHQSFPMSQSIGVSALASILPKNTQD